MNRLRRVISILLLAVGLLAAGAWVAGYFWWPQIGFPWPTAGLDQTHDRGFLVLIEGRLFLVRQRAEMAESDGKTQVPASIHWSNMETDGPPLQVDVRTLGTMSIAGGPAGANEPAGRQGRSIAMITVAAVEQGLADRPWRRLGFSNGVISAPRVMVNRTIATATISATAVPLWPFVLLAAPAAWLLFRGRRSRRWVAEGRCARCGYDLRESSDRCPECGTPVPAGGEALRTSPM